MDGKIIASTSDRVLYQFVRVQFGLKIYKIILTREGRCTVYHRMENDVCQFARHRDIF